MSKGVFIYEREERLNHHRRSSGGNRERKPYVPKETKGTAIFLQKSRLSYAGQAILAKYTLIVGYATKGFWIINGSLMSQPEMRILSSEEKGLV
jgi:hypothetical protein